jgi:hypothetical protein
VTTRARKAAPVLVCCDCHGRAESVCGGCGKFICGSEVCLLEHEHAPARPARKAAPHPNDQLRIEGGAPAVLWRCRACGMKLFAALRPALTRRSCENCGRLGFERIAGPSPSAKVRHP